MTDYLDLEDLLVAASAALGRPADVRDVGLLQAAVARPRATVFGVDAYATLDAKAASLLHSIVAGHALVDGNKRVGWVAIRLFYRFNGRDLQMPHDAAFALVVEIAEGRTSEVDDIASRLGPRVIPSDR